MRSIIKANFSHARDVASLMGSSLSLADAIETAAKLCVTAITAGNKLMLCGNGGSAADCQHIAAELVGRFTGARPGLAAIALTTDTSAITAIGNDFSFDCIFSRQVEAIATSGDVLIAISTSGNSENVLAAIRAAKAAGVKVIALTGERGGKMMSADCEALVRVPSSNTPRVQEAHIIIGHMLCEMIEFSLFGGTHG